MSGWLPCCQIIQSTLIHLPVSHCIPVHPTSQVQVSGAVQVPPFWQGLAQNAELAIMKGEDYMTAHCQGVFTWMHFGLENLRLCLKL